MHCTGGGRRSFAELFEKGDVVGARATLLLKRRPYTSMELVKVPPGGAVPQRTREYPQVLESTESSTRVPLEYAPRLAYSHGRAVVGQCWALYRPTAVSPW